MLISCTEVRGLDRGLEALKGLRALDFASKFKGTSQKRAGMYMIKAFWLGMGNVEQKEWEMCGTCTATVCCVVRDRMSVLMQALNSDIEFWKKSQDNIHSRLADAREIVRELEEEEEERVLEMLRDAELRASKKRSFENMTASPAGPASSESHPAMATVDHAILTEPSDTAE